MASLTSHWQNPVSWKSCTKQTVLLSTGESWGGGEPEQERLGGGWRESPSFPCLFELVAVTSMGTAAVFLSPAPGCRRQRLRFCMEVGKAREER